MISVKIDEKLNQRTISQSEIRFDDPNITVPSDVTSAAPGCRLVDAAMYAVDTVMKVAKKKNCRWSTDRRPSLVFDRVLTRLGMTILGIGVDIAHIPRFSALTKRRGPTSLARRILSQVEFDQWTHLDPSKNAQFMAVRYVHDRPRSD